MHCQTLENCCGVLEIGNFFRDPDIQQELKNWYFPEINDGARELPKVIIATTYDVEQPLIVEQLLAMKFTRKKIPSRHDTGRNKSLSFWMRTSLPPQIRGEINKKLKEAKKDDLW